MQEVETNLFRLHVYDVFIQSLSSINVSLMCQFIVLINQKSNLSNI